MPTELNLFTKTLVYVDGVTALLAALEYSVSAKKDAAVSFPLESVETCLYGELGRAEHAAAVEVGRVELADCEDMVLDEAVEV